MIIYGADRFGLSQLHQLRGRVGRGTKDSYCFVLSSSDAPTVRDRLSYFCSCSDGFELAEYDFDQRGGGDFIGTGQHGKSGDFAINAESIKVAKAISDELMQSEKYVKQIAETITDNRFEYFKNITLN
jgi:ATP-dependent DNA helicase RecG